MHDEIIAEVPDGFGSLEEFNRLLVEAPAWAEGLPIAAKVREGPRFSKPAEPETVGDVDAGEAAENADIGTEDVESAHVGTNDADMPPLAAEGLAEAAPEPADPPPFAFTFEQIRAAFAQSPGGENRGGNGHDHEYARNAGGGYPHGEQDTGQQAALLFL